MNDDCISRQAAIDAALSAVPRDDYFDEQIEIFINSIPPADVRPVGPKKYICHRCGKPFMSYHATICPQCDEDLTKEVLIARGDVRPVVKSEWIFNDNRTWHCKRCKSWIPDEQRYYANWCLCCGADMRE